MINKEIKEITNRYLGYALGEGNYYEAHENLWKAYETEKSLYLSKIFKDKLVFEKEVSYRKPERMVRDDIMESGISTLIQNSLDEEWAELLKAYPYRHLFSYITKDYSEEELELSKISSKILSLIDSVSLVENRVYEDMEFTNPFTKKVFKLRKGEKITKALKHFISDKELLNDIQVLYSQVVNTKHIKGTLCLSIHPLDYLTVSVNNSGWSSCFNTLEKGEYCASALGLFTSPNTMVAYLKGREDYDITYGETYSIMINNKKWRALVHMGEDGELVHVGRNYPYDSKDLVNEVIKMVGEIFNKDYIAIGESRVICDPDNKSSIKKVVIQTPENMYNDGSYTMGITKKWCEKSNFNYEVIDVSPVGSICPDCGRAYEDNEFDIRCSVCYVGDRCDDCGCPVHGDYGTWIDSADAYVCEDCLSMNYSYCTRCDEYIHHSVSHPVSRKDANWSETWCDSCLEDALNEGYISFNKKTQHYEWSL